jgi:hypothetical protein
VKTSGYRCPDCQEVFATWDEWKAHRLEHISATVHIDEPAPTGAAPEVAPAVCDTAQHLDRLDQLRRYLEERIAAKRRVGWETLYDESERDALAWALQTITGPVPSDVIPQFGQEIEPDIMARARRGEKV